MELLFSNKYRAVTQSRKKVLEAEYNVTVQCNQVSESINVLYENTCYGTTIFLCPLEIEMQGKLMEL